MKKIVLLSLLFAFCSVIPVFAAQKMYSEKEIRAIENCKYLGSSACYEELFETVDNSRLRLFYAIALLNEKQIDRAKEEFIDVKNTSRSNSDVIYAENYLTEINNLEETMRDAYYEDKGNYISDLKTTARWENPENIKVYIKGETGLEYLFENGFNIWKNSVSGLYFNYVENPNEADIICYFVDHFPDQKAGVTYYNGGTKAYSNNPKVKYINRPVKIEISKKSLYTRPMTNDELLSVIIHEIGHALGIRGHSKNKNDIMYYNTETYQNTTLSDRDINTLYEIYK